MTGEKWFGCKIFEIMAKKSANEGFSIQILLHFPVKKHMFFDLSTQLSSKSQLVSSGAIDFIIIMYLLIPKIFISF